MEVVWQTLGSHDSFTQCVVRLTAPNHAEHTPTHYVLLIDVSDSMNHDDKLRHVVQCLNILVGFVKEDDHFSLITFGTGSNVLLSRVPCTAEFLPQIHKVIHELKTDGMTNMGLGLQMCENVIEREDSKTGLFLLTDGYANHGLYTTDHLVTQMIRLQQKFPGLSVSNIAYGHDHNAQLLKIFTEQTQGVYAIVDSQESTAFAFGDALGGLLSCVAQNTKLKLPVGSFVHGPYPVETTAEGMEVSIGDLLSGTKKMILVDLPSASLQASLKTTLLPSLEAWESVATWASAEPDLEIHLTRLRMECTNLLKELAEYHGMREGAKKAFEEKVAVWKKEVVKPEYDGHPMALALRREVDLLDAGMQQNAPDLSATMYQHSATLAFGRGVSSPMRAPRSHRRRAPSPSPVAEDPTEATFQNEVQVRMSRLMRTMSSQP